MAQTRRNVGHTGDHPGLGDPCGQCVGIYRPTAHIVAGAYISCGRNYLDRAAKAVAHLDRNGIIQSATRCLKIWEVARVTGLEPATSGVTGRRSNQLSYTR